MLWIPTESDTKVVLTLNMYMEPVETVLGWAAETPGDQHNVHQRTNRVQGVLILCFIL